MTRVGVVSVTFRSLSVAEVAALAADCGLELVEWGGDVHVPAGDLRAAGLARRQCADRGLAVGGYGSYHKAGQDDPAAVAELVRTAVELGAPRLRVWAGVHGSAQASPDRRRAVVDALRAAADEAAAAGLGLTVEHHVDSLTDTLASALALRAEVAHPALVTHWQPRELPDTDECVTEVRALAPQVVHAFSWGADGFTERLPLARRTDLWRPVLAELAEQGGTAEVLLEFVPDDDPAALRRDAADLLGWRDAPAPAGAGAR